MDINSKVYDRACCLLDIGSCNMISLEQPEEEEATIISSYIHCMKDEVKDFEPSEIIRYLKNHREKYEIKRYVGLILVREYAVNPFDIYMRLIDGDDFYSMEAFFTGTFEYASYISNKSLLEIVDKIYSKTFASGTASPVLTDMLNYFKSNAKQLHEIFNYFLQNPSATCLWLICQRPELFAESDSESFTALMREYAISENPLVLSAVAVIAKNILYDLKLKFDFDAIVSSVVSKFQKYFNYQEYDTFILNCVPLVYCLLKHEEENIVLADLLRQGIGSNKDMRSRLLEEMRPQFTAWKGLDTLEMSFLMQICQNIDATSEKGAIDNIDWILSEEIKKGNIQPAWLCMCELSKRNEEHDWERALESSFLAITDRLEEFLPLIYNAVFNSSSVGSIEFKVLSYYRKQNDIFSVNWSIGITDENVISISKKIVISISWADFVIKWFLIILQNKALNCLDELYEIFATWVCRNYPVTVSREVKGFLEKTKCEDEKLREMVENCDDLMKKQDEILQKNDFTPDHSRAMKYQIEKKRALNMSLKKAEESSLFLMLATKVPIKYGNRFGSLRKDAGKYEIHDSGYNVNQYEYEPPLIFTLDPLLFGSCIIDAFKDSKS